MPFLYDVWNVKLQQWAKGLVWSRGGKHFSKTFSIFYMLNSKNRIFNPYFWLDACRMRKILLRIIREFNLLSFWWKNNRFLWNFCLAIFMGNPSLKLSEVLCYMILWLFKTLLHNLWILSFLLMFSSGHPNDCGHILIISNLLQPIVTSGTYFNRTTTWFPDSCFSLGIQIMVDRSSPVICYSQQLFSKELLH